jgi:hypothetical protein
MKLNDMHLEQGKAPDEKELQEWRDAHTEARYHLNKIGEFMHHEDYWHMHEHELQDIEANYTPETAGAEMADSYIPQGNQLDEGAIKDAEIALAAHAQRKIDHENKYGQMNAADLHSHEVIRKQLLAKKSKAQSAYRKKMAEEVEIHEGLSDIIKGIKRKVAGKEDPRDIEHTYGRIARSAIKHKTPDQAEKDINRWKKVNKVVNKEGVAEEVEIDEELTDKTIKSGDKIKVARVIADMLGVENAETMAPEAAINAGLRKIKNKRMTPELTGVITKMLGLAREVGVKIDPSLVPKSISEAVVNKKSTYNIAGDILRYKDFQKLKGVGQQNEADNTVVIDKGEIGATLHADQSADTVRKMKVKYKTEDVASADYKVNPETGRKYRAHKINFANSGMKDKLDPEQVKEEVEDFDFSEDDLEKMAGSVNTEDDIMHAYDDGELVLVDSETGEEINEEAIINTEILSEVMSRIERMKAKIRFARTEPKRERRMQIALKRRSDTKTLNKRARRVAIDLMKQRIMRKPAAQLTVSEKERVERILSKRKAAIDRLAMKLAPRVRKIETDRLSHSKATQS